MSLIKNEWFDQKKEVEIMVCHTRPGLHFSAIGIGAAKEQ